MLPDYFTPHQQLDLFGAIPTTTGFVGLAEEAILPSQPAGQSRALLQELWDALRSKDGPAFVGAVRKINNVFRESKDENHISRAVDSWTHQELPRSLVLHLVEQTYQRCVTPHIKDITSAKGFSNKTYGELRPNLVADIVQRTGLDENSLYLDLGSGIANTVTHASLQSGCRSYGIEVDEGRGWIAEDVVKDFSARCSVWGLKCGKVELERGDILESTHLQALIQEADVALLSNTVFSSELTEKVRPYLRKFKTGARIVSLVPLNQYYGKRASKHANNLAGLWSLLNFILPDIFTHLDVFQEWFSLPRMSEQLDMKGWKICRMDGSAPPLEHRDQMDEYQNGGDAPQSPADYAGPDTSYRAAAQSPSESNLELLEEPPLSATLPWRRRSGDFKIGDLGSVAQHPSLARFCLGFHHQPPSFRYHFPHSPPPIRVQAARVLDDILVVVPRNLSSTGELQAQVLLAQQVVIESGVQLRRMGLETLHQILEASGHALVVGWETIFEMLGSVCQPRSRSEDVLSLPPSLVKSTITTKPICYRTALLRCRRSSSFGGSASYHLSTACQ
uniref:Histone-lysine N-methyltransferase, H3 lysine-79 specific n=1 Tax=Mycena chlorophos TaxID=658473 RepID=A0ABQ0L8L8_MYCCL|nr:DOT1-domain-containing protein [Mycena chlorophos]